VHESEDGIAMLTQRSFISREFATGWIAPVLVTAVFCGILVPIGQASAAARSAADFPDRPIRIVIGFTPGGGPDITARYIAQKLVDRWKQPVVPDNRTGAGGNIAAETVANANPDGYTLLSVSSAHAVAPAIYPKLAYDTLRDFTGITLTASGPALLIVAPALGVKSAAELIAVAKAKPGQLNYSSAGVGSGSHFGAEIFKSMAGIEVVHIPFKGIPEALMETMAGRAHFFISPFASAIGMVREGKARAVAVTGLQRMAQVPDLPTVAESGLPGYRYDFWYGLLAPAKTPWTIVAKLNQEIRRILELPELKQRWAPLGLEPTPSSPEQFNKLVADEVAAFTRIARAANIKVN
jgi:tripartite-type tricarboxylate transporter receptor subunit TctC